MNEIENEIRAAMQGTPEGAAEDGSGKDIADDIAGAIRDQSGEEEARKPAEPEGKAEGEQVKPEGEQVKPEGEEQPKEGVKLDDKRAPTSWSAKVREKWGELPEEVRSEVLRREESHANGVRKLQEEFAPIRQFAETLTPVLQEAASIGQPPAQYIQNLAVAERSLRTGAPEQRFEALMNLADQYGLPLRQYLNLPAGQQQAQQPAIPPQVQAELEQSRQFREQMLQQQQQMQHQTVQQQVNEFASKNEFFEDVRELMADLMDANPSRTLQDAYEQAVWAHPEVRQVLLQRQQQESAKQQGQQRRSAAANASATSNDPGVTVQGDMGDTIEDVVRNAFRASTGRI